MQMKMIHSDCRSNGKSKRNDLICGKWSKEHSARGMRTTGRSDATVWSGKMKHTMT